MIPPIVRTGYPAISKRGGRYLLLVRNYGWVMAFFEDHHRFPSFYTGECRTPTGRPRAIDYTDILCWMPQDGS